MAPVSHRDAGIDPYARSSRNFEALDGARSGGKAILRIFGVQSHFNGVTNGARLGCFQATATCNVDLELHQVQSRRTLRHRMLHL